MRFSTCSEGITFLISFLIYEIYKLRRYYALGCINFNPFYHPILSWNVDAKSWGLANLYFSAIIYKIAIFDDLLSSNI
jgi:hypothetical protein